MKICIMGSGGLGGFFGGWLASAGSDVTFIARGAHLEAIRTDGLVVKSGSGNRHIRNAKATDNPAEVGSVDVILFCVKNYDLEDAAEACKPMLTADTAVVSVLNGVSAPERIGRVLGQQHVVPGLTMVPSNIAAPGVIAHLGDKVDLTFGEVDGSNSARLVAFRNLCQSAGLDARISEDIVTTIWAKFVAWSSAGAVAAASRQSFGGIQSTPELLRLFRDTTREACDVGRAKGAKLAENHVDIMEGVLKSYPAEAKSSTLVDLEKGKRLEIEIGCGAVVAMGDELGIETPINRALYATVLPYLNG